MNKREPNRMHRPMAGINDLDDILCWREQRSVSRQASRRVLAWIKQQDQRPYPS
jgi:hypothetical protein